MTVGTGGTLRRRQTATGEGQIKALPYGRDSQTCAPCVVWRWVDVRPGGGQRQELGAGVEDAEGRSRSGQARLPPAAPRLLRRPAAPVPPRVPSRLGQRPYPQVAFTT